MLNVGDVEKATDPVAKQPPAEEAVGTCGCKKSCNCNKAAVVFSDLYSTGNNCSISTCHGSASAGKVQIEKETDRKRERD